jgi:hypothetical protein
MRKRQLPHFPQFLWDFFFFVSPPLMRVWSHGGKEAIYFRMYLWLGISRRYRDITIYLNPLYRTRERIDLVFQVLKLSIFLFFYFKRRRGLKCKSERIFKPIKNS